MRAKAGLFLCALLCGVAAVVFPGVAGAADIGFPGPAYSAGTGGSPTGWKPESKLWWNDGFWWASVFDRDSDAYHIYGLRHRTQRWVDTGVTIDTRDSTRQDVLWTGDKLFIASHKFQAPATFSASPTADDAMRLHRFSYNAATNTYSPDGSTQIDEQRSETLVIEQDSAGKLWATWVQQEGPGGAYRVFVNTSSDGGATWSGRFALPGANEVSADDISSLIRFGSNKIGVMWGDQNDASPGMKFAFHVDGAADGAWSPIENASAVGLKFAEDHINLKADGAGRVYAAVRTKFSAAANPGTMLLVRDAVTGNWTSHRVTNAGFDHTRPIVLLDARRAYVFEVGGGVVYMKSSRLGAIAFSGGAGTPVIRDQSSAAVTNPTSTKQNLNGTTQLIVMASNNSTKRYWHAYRQLRPCINGTAGPNTLVGTAGDDRLCGRGGNDSVRGLGGNDLLSGGSGADQLVGDSGRDTFRAGRGKDTLFARDGRRELVHGGGGRDRARVDGTDIRRSIEALF
jgi:Ca2+-binding RTX toxin-like protein